MCIIISCRYETFNNEYAELDDINDIPLDKLLIIKELSIFSILNNNSFNINLNINLNNFINLKILYIECIENIDTIDIYSYNIKKLIIRCCRNLYHINFNFNNLTKLYLYECNQILINNIFNDNNFDNLYTLKCENYMYRYLSLRTCNTLTKLSIDKIILTDVNNNIFNNLKILHIKNLYKQHNNIVNKFVNLIELHLQNNNMIKLYKFNKLKKLKLWDENCIYTIPYLPKLQKLFIEGCDKLNLYRNNLPNLIKLIIIYNNYITHIPKYPKLHYILIYAADNIIFVPNNIKRLQINNVNLARY